MSLLRSLLTHFLLYSAVVVVLGVAALLWLERRWPRSPGRSDRVNNLALFVLGLLMTPGLALVQAQALELGSLRGFSGLAGSALPDLPKLLLGLVLADALQYLIHVASHRIPWLWRLHKLHHSELHLDASSSLRRGRAAAHVEFAGGVLDLNLVGRGQAAPARRKHRELEETPR